MASSCFIDPYWQLFPCSIWDRPIGNLRDVSFDGVATVCVFGWEEEADDIHRRMLDRVKTELRV